MLIFLGHDTPSWTELSSRFADWTKSNVVPPRIFLVANAAHATHLVKEAGEASADQLDVFEKQSRLVIAGVDCSGKVTEQDMAGGASGRDLTQLFEVAAIAFVSQACERGDVVVAAPPGFYFAKQSDRHSTHFMRAESLLSGTQEIALLALALLPKFHAFCETQSTGPTVRIFLDSMAVWPIAQMLVQAHRVNNATSRRYEIQSFRGYDGLATWDSVPGAAFVIISASTSGGLEAKVRKMLGPKNVVVTTILALEAAHGTDERVHPDGHVLFRLPRKLKGEPALEGLRDEFLPDVKVLPPGAESVRVIGERFLSHNNRPKLVRLAAKELSSSEKSTLAELTRENLAVVARRRAIDNGWWSLSLDVERMITKYARSADGKLSLVESWVRNFAAPGPVAVVYPKDARVHDTSNSDLAHLVRDMVGHMAPDAPVRVMDHTALEVLDKEQRAFLKAAGVIVVTPILSNGFIFKQISASLRIAQPEGPRLYIALAVLPETPRRLGEISMDLGTNAVESPYRFKRAFAFPVGRMDQTMRWDQESQILSNVVEACDEKQFAVPELLTRRLDGLRTQEGLKGELTFLPTFNGKPQPLSAGFRLWETQEPISGAKHGSGVLLTVAVFLEACRNARSGDVETALRSGVFQHTLIEPASFTRFNDGSIQAAMLRAAYPAELNYAVDRDASKDMGRLIEKFIDLYNEPAGSAVAEFLLALALGRLSLHRDELGSVRNAAKALPEWLGILSEHLPN